MATGGRNGHVVGGLLDPRRPDREFSCASCHNPHGSDHVKLFYIGDGPMEMCDGCHGNKSGANPGMVSVIHKARPAAAQTGAAGSAGAGAGGGGAGGGAGGGGGGSGSDVSTTT